MNLSVILAAAVAANQSWAASVDERKLKQEAEAKAVADRLEAESREGANRADLESKAKKAYDALLGVVVEDPQPEPAPETEPHGLMASFGAVSQTPVLDRIEQAVPAILHVIRLFLSK